jgi:Domain of unknown function (DUF6484)
MSAKPKKQSPKVVPLHPEPPVAQLAMRFGTVKAWSENDGILVDYPGSPSGPQPATTTVRLSAAQIQALIASQDAVCLTFDPSRPAHPVLFALTQPIAHAPAPNEGEPMRAVVDGEVVEIEGAERVVLRCGKASIVLTKEGKILLNGTYLASESTGAHRIRGGSVEIN